MRDSRACIHILGKTPRTTRKTNNDAEFPMAKQGFHECVLDGVVLMGGTECYGAILQSLVSDPIFLPSLAGIAPNYPTDHHKVFKKCKACLHFKPRFASYPV